MTAERDLAARIATAVVDHYWNSHIGTPPADCCTDVVEQILEEAFVTPASSLEAAPELSPAEAAAWQQRWDHHMATTPGAQFHPITTTPPNAYTLRRRTPEQRHAYLAEHRQEAIDNGIPEALIDWMIQDAQPTDQDPEEHRRTPRLDYRAVRTEQHPVGEH